jgi:hypothetical protein
MVEDKNNELKSVNEQSLGSAPIIGIIPITHVPYVINAPGVYAVNANLIFTPTLFGTRTAIRIRRSNVQLNFAGFTLEAKPLLNNKLMEIVGVEIDRDVENVSINGGDGAIVGFTQGVIGDRNRVVTVSTLKFKDFILAKPNAPVTGIHLPRSTDVLMTNIRCDNFSALGDVNGVLVTDGNTIVTNGLSTRQLKSSQGMAYGQNIQRSRVIVSNNILTDDTEAVRDCAGVLYRDCADITESNVNVAGVCCQNAAYGILYDNVIGVTSSSLKTVRIESNNLAYGVNVTGRSRKTAFSNIYADVILGFSGGFGMRITGVEAPSVTGLSVSNIRSPNGSAMGLGLIGNLAEDIRSNIFLSDISGHKMGAGFVKVNSLHGSMSGVTIKDISASAPADSGITTLAVGGMEIGMVGGNSNSNDYTNISVTQVRQRFNNPGMAIGLAWTNAIMANANTLVVNNVSGFGSATTSRFSAHAIAIGHDVTNSQFSGMTVQNVIGLSSLQTTGIFIETSRNLLIANSSATNTGNGFLYTNATNTATKDCQSNNNNVGFASFTPAIGNSYSNTNTTGCVFAGIGVDDAQSRIGGNTIPAVSNPKADLDDKSPAVYALEQAVKLENIVKNTEVGLLLEQAIAPLLKE